MKYTVLGSTGFIGRNLVCHLRARNYEVETPSHDVTNLRGKQLGHVIYAIGLTGNFRTLPQAAIEAHVNVLQKLMDGAGFDSWLYLSSTRVYGGLSGRESATEEMAVPILPGADSVYDLSKLLGEAICLGRDDATVRVARLSNVYGPGQSKHTFLGSAIRDLVTHGRVSIGEDPLSSKDYISIDDAVESLVEIARQGKERLYNVASGRPVTHQALAEVIRRCGYAVEFPAGMPVRRFPAIGTERLVREFGGRLRSIIDDLPGLIAEEKRVHGESHSKTRQNENAEY